MADDEKRPSWAKDPAIWTFYQRTVEKAHEAGWTQVSCGWAIQPEPHGEMRLGKGPFEAIIVVDRSPAAAVGQADWLLNRLAEAEEWWQNETVRR